MQKNIINIIQWLNDTIVKSSLENKKYILIEFCNIELKESIRKIS